MTTPDAHEHHPGSRPGTRSARRAERRRASRAKRQAALERSAERQMRDTRFDGLRTPARRRLLAAAVVILIAATSGLFWVGATLVGTLVLVVGIAAWLLLRVSVRTIADLPDELLDERQERIRSAAYLESYRWLAGLVGGGLSAVMLAVILSGTDPDAITLDLDLDQVQAIFWAFIGSALSLPSLVIALREPSI